MPMDKWTRDDWAKARQGWAEAYAAHPDVAVALSVRAHEPGGRQTFSGEPSVPGPRWKAFMKLRDLCTTPGVTMRMADSPIGRAVTIKFGDAEHSILRLKMLDNDRAEEAADHVVESVLAWRKANDDRQANPR